MGRRSKRGQHSIIMPEVNLTPLIDTALVLLVVFMVTAPIMKHGIQVDLPEGKSKEVKEPNQDLVVSIDKEGKVYFGDKENAKALSMNELLDVLKKTSGKDKTVFVKGDRGVNYGKVIEVVDQIKYVGDVKYVALAMAPRS